MAVRLHLSPVISHTDEKTGQKVGLQAHPVIVNADGTIPVQDHWPEPGHTVIGFAKDFTAQKITWFWEDVLPHMRRPSGMYPVIADPADKWATYPYPVESLETFVTAFDGQNRATGGN